MKSSYSNLQTETISAFSTLPHYTRATENWQILKGDEYIGIHYTILLLSVW